MFKYLRLTSLFCAILIVTACGGGSPSSDTQSTPTPISRASTAQANVLVLPELLLQIPVLNRQRQIRLYLPTSYATSNKRYPVLYMHDGQNLFDNATSYVGEWGVDESMNELANSDNFEAIVVGIDNGEFFRMAELNPFDSDGEEYMDFIVNVVKPLIDTRYRTLPDRANTAIMGSSMGGQISHYAVSKYPTVFSKAGIFSPSYPAVPQIFNFIATHPAPSDARLYILTGGLEVPSSLDSANQMYTFLLQQGHPAGNVSLKIVSNGIHKETFWGAEFKQAVRWMFQPQ